MITLSQLGKSFGAQTLFSDVSMQLNRGERIGLVGANGCGKSTLLKILIGDEPESAGEVQYARGLKLGVLRQDQFLNDHESILNVAMAGDVEAAAALAEWDKLSHSADPDVDRLGELNDLLVAHDGYTLESRASEILEGLGIELARHREPLGTLSGGYKLRVLLTQVLVANIVRIGVVGAGERLQRGILPHSSARIDLLRTACSSQAVCWTSCL